ncbi:MAG: hypothetical protein K8R68_04575 [Bacteroidales bacterium]|nr:hypothetical protein [Bacteroidales bacterium]
MKKVIFTFCIIVFVILSNAYGQDPVIELNFTADNNGQVVTLDSVWVKNLTQGLDTTLYSGNLTLIIDTINTGIINLTREGDFSITNNFPNPFLEKTHVNVFIPKKGNVALRAFNISGQEMVNYYDELNKGNHSFTFYPGCDLFYILSVTYNGQTQSCKMFNKTNKSNGVCHIEYSGYEYKTTILKAITQPDCFDYDPGDQLLFVGYADAEQSGLVDSPMSNQDYEFQFATNIPCPGAPTVEYEGQVYNTIQVFSQCWFKENLNVGERIHATLPQTNNDTIEKYCFLNHDTHCDANGGLYSWNEMMQYTNETGYQGICPEGWHLPDDIEWQILEGSVDSQYGIGDPEWKDEGWRGSDAGGNLKETGTSNWQPPNSGATDAFGFTALPAGYFIQNDGFYGLGWKTYLWSSHYPGKYWRNLDSDQIAVRRDEGGGGAAALSVRCIKDL